MSSADGGAWTGREPSCAQARFGHSVIVSLISRTCPTLQSLHSPANILDLVASFVFPTTPPESTAPSRWHFWGKTPLTGTGSAHKLWKLSAVQKATLDPAHNNARCARPHDAAALIHRPMYRANAQIPRVAANYPPHPCRQKPQPIPVPLSLVERCAANSLANPVGIRRYKPSPMLLEGRSLACDIAPRKASVVGGGLAIWYP